MSRLLPRFAPIGLALAAVFGGAAESVHACEFAAQRIVAAKTVEALPEPLGDYLSKRLDGVFERTVEPGGAWRRDPRFKSRATWHHLMLDAAAADDTSAARLAAARAFPADRGEARRLFRDHNVTQGGELIWRLEEQVEALSEAIEAGDEDAIVRLSGYVIHFCTDAANPFHATCDRRGARLGNRDFGRHDMGDPLFAHQDVSHRAGWELVRRNAERYRDAIDAESLRFELAADIRFMALEKMVEAISEYDAICEADRKIMASMTIDDEGVFLARADEYYDVLDGAIGASAVENLRRGIRLAATAIVSAWTRAKSPATIGATDTESSSGDAGSVANEGDGEKPKDETSDSADEGELIVFVASKNSKVFHRADCPHSRRINPKNLVQFASATDAAASGRRPCRTCKPADP